MANSIEHRVKDAGSMRIYRTEIPNIVGKLSLSPFEYRLYGCLKQIAGDAGACWMSSDSLAAETCMSKATVNRAKKNLALPREQLGGKALIMVEDDDQPQAGRGRHIITIVDIWPENMQAFASDAPNGSHRAFKGSHRAFKGSHRAFKGSHRAFKGSVVVPNKTPNKNHTVLHKNEGLSCASAKPDDAILLELSPENIEKDTLESRFERWYRAYPRKRNKGDAQKAWNALKPSPAQLAAMLAALEWQRDADDWRKEGGRFVPYPASYLRARGWEDEREIDTLGTSANALAPHVVDHDAIMARLKRPVGIEPAKTTSAERSQSLDAIKRIRQSFRAVGAQSEKETTVKNV